MTSNDENVNFRGIKLWTRMIKCSRSKWVDCANVGKRGGVKLPPTRVFAVKVKGQHGDNQAIWVIAARMNDRKRWFGVEADSKIQHDDGGRWEKVGENQFAETEFKNIYSHGYSSESTSLFRSSASDVIFLWFKESSWSFFAVNHKKASACFDAQCFPSLQSTRIS